MNKSFTFLGLGESLIVIGENWERFQSDTVTILSALGAGLYYQGGLYFGDLFSLLYGYNL